MLRNARVWRLKEGKAALRAALHRFRCDQRGSVALLTAVSAVPLVMIVGMGIEISNWAVVQLELQRTADLAALAGMEEYIDSNNAQSAAISAASLAELNGAVGAPTRIWDGAKKLLSDNNITAQIKPGVRDILNIAMQVTVNQTVPLSITRVMSSMPSIVVSATAWAEIIPKMQPCVLALNASGAGVNAQGSVFVSLTGCSIRSNASISTGGAATMAASAFYAAGTITGSETGGPRYPNDGTISDPYANYSPVQNALNHLIPGHGSSFSDNNSKSSTPLIPGEWSSWDIKGTVILAPGIYYVNGDILLGGGSSLSGYGVTVVISGSFNMTGGAVATLSAAIKGSEMAGAIPGIAFAGSSTFSSSLSGGTNPSLTGVFYYPNGALTFGGTAQGGSNGCLQVIALSITLQGNPSLASKCSAYGTLPFSSENATAATLVQ